MATNMNSFLNPQLLAALGQQNPAVAQQLQAQQQAQQQAQAQQAYAQQFLMGATPTAAASAAPLTATQYASGVPTYSGGPIVSSPDTVAAARQLGQASPGWQRPAQQGYPGFQNQNSNPQQIITPFGTVSAAQEGLPNTTQGGTAPSWQNYQQRLTQLGIPAAGQGNGASQGLGQSIPLQSLLQQRMRQPASSIMGNPGSLGNPGGQTGIGYQPPNLTNPVATQMPNNTGVSNPTPGMTYQQFAQMMQQRGQQGGWGLPQRSVNQNALPYNPTPVAV